MSTGESGVDLTQSFRRLVIVCCHAIYLGEAPSGREEDEWYCTSRDRYPDLGMDGG